MTFDRRQILCGLGGFTAAAALGTLDARASQTAGFPRKRDFLIDDSYTYLNAAYTHPIPSVSLEAVRRAALGRSSLPPPTAGASGTPRTLFAELVNAKPSEIAYVSSTSAGENLVVQALELDRRVDGNVVTDGLHFEGAILHLLELKKQGLDVRVVKPTTACRIDLADLEKVVDRRTRLIEVSSASMYNGFQHDLKAVCDLAHAHGAYVYADIIHSAGAEPFDVKASGVANIQAHRLPLIRKLQQEVPRLGFTPATPPESTGPLVTFARTNIGQTEIPRKLQAAKVNVRLSTHWMRLSPSVYNDMADIERFLDVLS